MTDIAVTQEKSFIIDLDEESGLLTFGIKQKSGEPEEPRIVYDGGEHALFYRTPNQVVLLDYINEALRDKLFAAERVLISEFNPDDFNIATNVYTAEMEKTDKVTFSTVGFESYENLIAKVTEIGEKVMAKIDEIKE